MKDKKRHAVASIVMSGHEERVLIRPNEKLLTMTVLYLEHQLKNSSDFSAELVETKITTPEVKLAGDLLESFSSSEIDFSQYQDTYTERVQTILDAKLKGIKLPEEIATPTAPVVNLMEALRKSLKKKADSAKSGTERTRNETRGKRAGRLSSNPKKRPMVQPGQGRRTHPITRPTPNRFKMHRAAQRSCPGTPLAASFRPKRPRRQGQLKRPARQQRCAAGWT
jgi:hypothetical protein